LLLETPPTLNSRIEQQMTWRDSKLKARNTSETWEMVSKHKTLIYRRRSQSSAKQFKKK
jgi:hypothetical protein